MCTYILICIYYVFTYIYTCVYTYIYKLLVKKCKSYYFISLLKIPQCLRIKSNFLTTVSKALHDLALVYLVTFTFHHCPRSLCSSHSGSPSVPWTHPVHSAYGLCSGLTHCLQHSSPLGICVLPPIHHLSLCSSLCCSRRDLPSLLYQQHPSPSLPQHRSAYHLKWSYVSVLFCVSLPTKI